LLAEIEAAAERTDAIRTIRRRGLEEFELLCKIDILLNSIVML